MRWNRLIGLLCVLAVAASACGTAAANDDVVRVYSARHYDLERAFDQFAEETGVSVEFLYGEDAQLRERIEAEGEDLNRWLEHATESYAESLTYLPDLEGYNRGPEAYLNHLSSVKKSVSIPVIASLNGVSLGAWHRYARMLQDA